MYNLFQIKQVGIIHIVGGVAVALAGFIVEAFFMSGKGEWFSVLTTTLVTLAVFGIGWHLFNQVVMGQTYANLLKGLSFNREPMKRLKEPPSPPRRLGLGYQATEIVAMLLAIVMVAIVTALVGKSGGFSLGGFAGGWLVGGGFGRIRWFGKVSRQEQEQERTFYFSDATAGPRTEMAFYEPKPGKRTLEETHQIAEKAKIAKTTDDAALPPGVRRRVGNQGKNSGPVRKQAKVGPLVSNTKPQTKSPAASPTEDQQP